MRPRSNSLSRAVHLGLLAAVVALGTTAGCARSFTQSEIKFLETREIQLPYHEVYAAALNAIFSMGMTIEHSDKDSGVITGRSGDYTHRATLAEKKQKSYKIKRVTLLITPRGPRVAQIRMKVMVDEEQQLDRKLMTAVWQRIEREAMLDASPNRRRASARARR